MRRPYPTDLSDAEWFCMEPYLPTPKAPGRPRVHSLREILNAIFYIVRSGCAWRLLPHDFPPWNTVHHYFRMWRLDGGWERLNTALRQRLRVRLGRNPQPSAGMVDSQSAKRPGWAAKHGATTAVRRFAAGSVICWWIRKGWYSKPRSTAPRSPTRTGSSWYWRQHVIAFRVLLTYG